MKKNKVEFVSAESSVCLPLSSSSGSAPGNVSWCPSLALGSLFMATSKLLSVAVSFTLGWSSQICPAGFLSAQGPGIVHPLSESTACTTSTCPQMGLLVRLGGCNSWFSPGRGCSVFRDGGGYVPQSLHHTSWSAPDCFQQCVDSDEVESWSVCFV